MPIARHHRPTSRPRTTLTDVLSPLSQCGRSRSLRTCKRKRHWRAHTHSPRHTLRPRASSAHPPSTPARVRARGRLTAGCSFPSRSAVRATAECVSRAGRRARRGPGRMRGRLRSMTRCWKCRARARRCRRRIITIARVGRRSFGLWVRVMGWTRAHLYVTRSLRCVSCVSRFGSHSSSSRARCVPSNGTYRQITTC